MSVWLKLTLMQLDVGINGTSIKLGQFLKLANLAESGGHAKELIASGEVEVNGEVVDSRGLLLRDGDLISTPDATATVRAGGVSRGVSGGGTDSTSAEEDYFDERTANDDFDPEKWRNL